MWWPVRVQILYRAAESDGFRGAFADSMIYGHWDLGVEGRAAISWKNLLAFVSFLATGGQRDSLPFFRPSRPRMQARSSAASCDVYERCRHREDIGTCTAWRFPSNPRPSSTQQLDENLSKTATTEQAAETAERTVRGRTSRRHPLAFTVGAGLRRFIFARPAGRCRAAGRGRIADFGSGDFRREGMGAPGWLADRLL